MSVTKDQAEIALKKFMHRLEESVLRRLDTADSAQNLVAAAALLEGGAELEAAYTAPDANSADLTLLHGTKMLDAANFAASEIATFTRRRPSRTGSAAWSTRLGATSLGPTSN